MIDVRKFITGKSQPGKEQEGREGDKEGGKERCEGS